MNRLKSWILLYGIKQLPAVSVFEICDKMRPYLRLFRLSLVEKAILFPEKISLCQYLEQQRHCGRQYDSGIPYESIVIVEQQHNEVSLYLRTGHVFTFSSGSHEWKVTEVYTRKHTRR